MKQFIRAAVTAGLIIAIALVLILALAWYRFELAQRCDPYSDKPAAATPADCREYLVR